MQKVVPLSSQVRRWAGRVGAFLLLSIVVLLALRWWTEWLWFAALGYQEVLLKSALTKLALFALGALLGYLLLVRNFLRSRELDGVPAWGQEPTDQLGGGRVLWVTLPALLAVASLALGLALARDWQGCLAAFAAVPSGQVDPVFGRDVSFYMLQLPFWSAVQRLLFGVVLVAWAGLYFRYVDLPVPGNEESFGDLRAIVEPARGHLSWIGALLFGVWAWGFYLARFNLLVSSRTNALWGVGFTDAHVRLPLLTGMVALAAIVAVVMLANTRRRSLATLGWSLGIFALALLVTTILPAVYQRLIVTPNEIEREKPYIARCIAATNNALGLSQTDLQSYEVQDRLPGDELATHTATLSTIPLWSPQEITEQLVGTESLRTYYNLYVTDFDRYRVDGKLEQVAVTAREMQVDRLDPRSQTWVNRHLVYTHGYGLVMASAHDAGSAGEPHKLIRDIPPLTPLDLPLTQPRVYYPFGPADYIVTGLRSDSQTREFDYPKGNENVYSSYDGEGGLPLGGIVRRLALALRFKSLNLLVSDLPAKDAKIHFRRDLMSRLQTLTPFLVYDSDPYPVLADGQIDWIADAYTCSTAYPYSWPYPLYPAEAVSSDQPERLLSAHAAYLRNSVKVVVSAYDGRPQFHVYDPDDPLLQTWRKIFPSLFTDAPLPEAVAKHVRYPNDLFTLQARAYARFHMLDPEVFYNAEDLWELAREETTTRYPNRDGSYSFTSTRERMAPYYVLLKLPGEAAARFRLIVPFTPASAPEALTGRDNMVGWLTVDCDPGEDYGKLTVFAFPKNRLIYGPMQIEALIDQDADISQQLTLWSEQGSRVLRGHLLVLPLGTSLLYVEPLYITAERRGALPELKRVVVFYNGRIRMADTLEQALSDALSGERHHSGAVELLRIQRQSRSAQNALAEADAARKAGDLSGYGEALDKLRRALGQMTKDAEHPEQGDASTARP